MRILSARRISVPTRQDGGSLWSTFVEAVQTPAGLARSWKPCGLRPFPWKACGLRSAHRRRSGAFRPRPPGPHPFHGAPGRTGPAGLPTGFPPPRPLAGDRFAFSTRSADGGHQRQQGCLGNPLKFSSPPTAPQRLTSCTSLFHELPLLVVQENGGRCTGKKRSPPPMVPRSTGDDERGLARCWWELNCSGRPSERVRIHAE